MIDWKQDLTEDQIIAAQHKGAPACLLAGPGTGKTKTLTHRVLSLVAQHAVLPEKILALTFTRVAAFQLREKLKEALSPLGISIPSVSTLHAFALRQLLRNSSQMENLRQPLRIADDWEERHIIQEDLKCDLAAHLKQIFPDVTQDIRKIQKLFHLLSADWETLKINADEQTRFCKDPKFKGAWRAHGEVFG